MRVVGGSAALVWASSQRRMTGGQIVFLNGAFDLLHVGHVRLFAHARTLGSIVVCGVNADSTVRARKGADRPRIPEAERAEMVAALRDVDVTFIFDEAEPSRWVNGLRPDFLLKGSDYAAQPVPEAARLAEWGGRLVLAPWPKQHHSSALAGPHGPERGNKSEK